MPENPVQRNQSLVKAMQIVETIAANRSTMRLQDISAAVKMPVSTVSRILNTFSIMGYVYQDPDTLQYGLTYKFSDLSSATNMEETLKNCGHQILMDLFKEADETCTLIIESNHEINHIDVIESKDNLLSVHIAPGQTFPLYCTAAGKLFLLNRSPEQLEKYLEETTFTSYTANTITDGKVLKEELEQARVMKWAMEDEEVVIGARTIASGVTDESGRIIAAISVSAPVSRLTSKKIPILTALIQNAAEQLSLKLGSEQAD